MVRGRPFGSKAETSRELTKRQRWTVEEWAEVEKASAAADETPSDFIRAATMQRCRKRPDNVTRMAGLSGLSAG